MTRTWQELEPRQRSALAWLAAVELVCTAVAAVDLARRPSSRIRGPKAAWWPAIFIQPIGAPVYLIWGRRRRG
ncbi:PLDc N-terminal domain-containing protein [Actinoplanes solisilvae]|uniref:PLDc N-terminal domain-containing protein n=1 Tax=Actinoplanes solisilvae TaxID=2486853 RepID=UPI000FD9D9FE|nr:PLD nuclease N-terminal domain-containing protein [Actinoplanes solisilvae]